MAASFEEVIDVVRAISQQCSHKQSILDISKLQRVSTRYDIRPSFDPYLNVLQDGYHKDV
jgi:hypothetical protein